MSESMGEIVLYQRGDGTPAIEVRLADETVWLSQQQSADLFQTSQQNVSLHLRNIYDDGELQESATYKDCLLVRQEGAREVSRRVAHYNLDAIISLGYRVQSAVATRFRIWATERLREYLIKGFTMNDEALKDLGGGRYWRELLDLIRDIRSSEKVLYRQVLDLYATSVDYDPEAPVTKEFFAVVQHRLHFAAHGRTAAEVIAARVDAGQPNLGLTNFTGETPTKAEAQVAKNYLTEVELKKLNTLVSAYFDAAEFRAQNHEPTYMADWLRHLERIITALDAPVLDGAGKVRREQMLQKADSEWTKYRAMTDAQPTEIERHFLAHLRQTQRRLEGRS